MRYIKKNLFIFIFVFLTIFGKFDFKIYSYERVEHDKYMLEVLFKNFKHIENDSVVADEIKALTCATYLVIDQFNGNGQKDLDFLLSYGVKGIPENVLSISFNASGTTHRSHTHRGWDFQFYTITKDIWPKRKQILLNTVDTIFNFNGNEAQKDSFCALLYYIHVLGDHMDDNSYLIKNGLKMDVGGRIDKNDIINELLKHFEILFYSQKNTHKYFSLTSNLQKYNTNLAALVRSEGGINSEEKFQQKQFYTKKIMNLLIMYVPEMLKQELFFQDVFY